MGLVATLEKFRQSAGWILLEYILAVVSIVGIVLAFWAAIESRKQTNELKRSLSTRVVAEFPGNLPDLITMLDKARDKIDIWEDTIGYGEFSAPEKFQEYLGVLEKKRSLVHVHYYDQNTTLVARLRQFRPDEVTLYAGLKDFDGTKPRDYNENFTKFQGESSYDSYSRTLKGDQLRTLKDWKGFFALLQEQDDTIEKTLRDLFGVNISRHDRRVPILVWFVDWQPDRPTGGGKAMFSIDGGGAGETAFYTEDPSLLCSLYSIVEPKQKQCAM
jgi:hypothetical protein